MCLYSLLGFCLFVCFFLCWFLYFLLLLCNIYINYIIGWWGMMIYNFYTNLYACVCVVISIQDSNLFFPMIYHLDNIDSNPRDRLVSVPQDILALDKDIWDRTYCHLNMCNFYIWHVMFRRAHILFHWEGIFLQIINPILVFFFCK